MKYDFEGKTEYAVTRHKRINSNTEQVIKNSFAYSPQGRVLEHVHKINNLPDEQLAEYQYDELGRVISKSTGVNNNIPLQQIDYRYNIRGWLTHINDVEELQKSGAPLDVFAYKSIIMKFLTM